MSGLITREPALQTLQLARDAVEADLRAQQEKRAALGSRRLRVLQVVLDGKSYREAAKQPGLTYSTVKEDLDWLRQQGVPIPVGRRMGNQRLAEQL